MPKCPMLNRLLECRYNYYNYYKTNFDSDSIGSYWSMYVVLVEELVLVFLALLLLLVVVVLV